MAHWMETAEYFGGITYEQYLRLIKRYKELNSKYSRAELARRAIKDLPIDRGPIPSAIESQIIWNDNGSEALNEGGERDIWWKEVVSDRRYERWVPVGPDGRPGVFIGRRI